MAYDEKITSPYLRLAPRTSVSAPAIRRLATPLTRTAWTPQTAAAAKAAGLRQGNLGLPAPLRTAAGAAGLRAFGAGLASLFTRPTAPTLPTAPRAPATPAQQGALASPRTDRVVVSGGVATRPATTARGGGGIMSVRAQIAEAARYTGQALFGGFDARTGGAFAGAYDREGNLVNPEMKPNLMSPEVAQQLGIDEDTRAIMGYNPKWPYNLLPLAEPVPGGIGGGGPGAGAGGISFGGGGGAGAGRMDTLPLTMWRV